MGVVKRWFNRVVPAPVSSLGMDIERRPAMSSNDNLKECDRVKKVEKKKERSVWRRLEQSSTREHTTEMVTSIRVVMSHYDSLRVST